MEKCDANFLYLVEQMKFFNKIVVYFNEKP